MGSNRWRHHFLTQSEEAQDREQDNNEADPPDYVVHACLLELVHIQMMVKHIRPSFVRLLVTYSSLDRVSFQFAITHNQDLQFNHRLRIALRSASSSFAFFMKGHNQSYTEISQEMN